MNGPNSMYKMRPIIKLAEEIDLPKCMYKMKVIQNSHCVVQIDRSTNDRLASAITEQKPMPEVVALENRQEAILVQLAQLKQQLNNLREQLKKPTSCTSIKIQVQNTYKNGLHDEIVVKANPKRPPYSLLALNRLLQNSINIRNYVHSTTEDLGEILKQFNKTSNSPLFNIRLIWKDGPPELNYEASGDAVFASIADELLDTCYRIVKETTIKGRQIHFKLFGAALQKYQFLMGDNVSVVDIAGWSALKQIGYVSKDLPSNVNTWIESIGTYSDLVISGHVPDLEGKLSFANNHFIIHIRFK
ncbi:Aminoacyl tRNA synthase complex-interacting multifunctional protein 2 [Gryllus bimaculatus]|nr:Aminoacyl tRNA synthase complex-interacting multifunctional protein 2 [Gryllus bimaculatus]